MQNFYKREGKGRESDRRISIKGKVKAVRVIAEAVGVIKEANQKISDAVRLFVKVVGVLAESL